MYEASKRLFKLKYKNPVKVKTLREYHQEKSIAQAKNVATFFNDNLYALYNEK